MIPDRFISLGYLREQVILHARPNGYGGKGGRWTVSVWELLKALAATSVLDYGCGRGQLGENLRAMGVDVQEYDPAVRGRDLLPEPADLVVCTDVLEHIEPDKLDTILSHLRSLARCAVFVVVATRPSNKMLTDGRNAHLIIESADWWAARVQSVGFTMHELAPPPQTPGHAWAAVLRP